jgi:protein-disulfide isomerase/uncharacterized membrane protein
VNRGRLYAVAALSAAGAGVATYLTSIHVRHLSTGAASSCNFGGAFNCDVVNTSAYSELAGVPVSHLGLLLYLTALLLSVVGLRKEALRPRLHLLLALMAAGAVVVSLGLAYISLFVLKAICVFCLTLYAINLGLLGVMLPGLSSALRAARGPEPRPGALGAALRGLGDAAIAGPLIGLVCGFGFSAAYLMRTLFEVRAKAAAHKELIAPIDAPRVDLVTATAPSHGPANAPLTIVEVSDFECPFCRRTAATLKELVKLYPGQIRVVFRHFPLDQACNSLLTRPLHEHACEAARAAVCAAQRDPARFFALADKLFEGDAADFTSEAINQAVAAVGLVSPEFEACQKGQAAADAVARDIRECNAAGVRAVPVLFINGRAVRGTLPLEAYQKVIDEELRRASALPVGQPGPRP